MSWQAMLLFGVAVAILLGLFVYWLIWISEGAYLGSWAVRWLYDWGARTYDDVKQYVPADEAVFLGNPLFSRLEEDFGPHSLLLDVATGTGRLPLALFAIPFYEGEIVALDISREMLAEAARKCVPYRDRIAFLHHPAVPLPFEDETFDAVTSMEALEFMPDRHATLREMVRVLRPGGWFVISNRIGLDAQLMPGRTDSREALELFLGTLGLVDIFTRPWQVDYDLVFARKAGSAGEGRGLAGTWLMALRCPHCGSCGEGRVTPDEWYCAACDYVIDIGEDGVWELGG
ncbi:MAG: methyltransferase domain-containing protein [Chloroflexota bacterium]|nr:methyltransferase domain-containing protein [Chloroflexota bacterium]